MSRESLRQWRSDQILTKIPRRGLKQTLEFHVEHKCPQPHHPWHSCSVFGWWLPWKSVGASDQVQTEADPKGTVAGGCELTAFLTQWEISSYLLEPCDLPPCHPHPYYTKLNIFCFLCSWISYRIFECDNCVLISTVSLTHIIISIDTLQWLYQFINIGWAIWHKWKDLKRWPTKKIRANKPINL